MSPVANRVKILKCASFEEAESKVNDFLAFDQNITELVQIDYRLEFSVVIIDYVINNNNDIDNDDVVEGKKIIMKSVDDNNNLVGDLSYVYSGPLITWWKLCFPFSRF